MIPRAPKVPTRPLSFRLTESEREALVREAGEVPLGPYLRLKVLGRASVRRSADRDPGRIQIASALALMGQSNVAANLELLAQAVRDGGLPVNTETERSIAEACAAVLEIRACLMAALGLRKETVQ